VCKGNKVIEIVKCILVSMATFGSVLCVLLEVQDTTFVFSRMRLTLHYGLFIVCLGDLMQYIWLYRVELSVGPEHEKSLWLVSIVSM